MNNVAYKFLEHEDTKGDSRVNYSFMQEKEACKQNESRVEYLFLEYSEGKK